MKVAACSLLAAATLACGYRPVYGGDGAQERLHVALVRSSVPYAVAGDEVVSGVREALAREGALDPGQGYPRVEIEVLRVDESSEGIAASGGRPVARGIQVGLLARAWLVRAADGPRERDTGDVRAIETIATDPGPVGAVFHQEDALRAAARRAGHKLGMRILGQPAAVEDVYGRER